MIEIVLYGFFKYYNEKYKKIYLELENEELYKLKQQVDGAFSALQSPVGTTPAEAVINTTTRDGARVR